MSIRVWPSRIGFKQKGFIQSIPKEKAVRTYKLEGSNYKKDTTGGHLFLIYNSKSNSKNIYKKNLGSLRGAF